jgi:hypothetical protein
VTVPVAEPFGSPPPPQPEAPQAAPPAVDPPPLARPRSRRRPIFGWIAFSFVLLAYVAVAAIAIYAYLQTTDAFIQGPPWWALTSQLATLPVGILCLLGFVLGILGVARLEKPAWPAIAAMIFSLPGFGYVALAAFVWFTVTSACAGPSGACGV